MPAFSSKLFKESVHAIIKRLKSTSLQCRYAQPGRKLSITDNNTVCESCDSSMDMDALRQDDDWRRVAEEHFSVDNIRKYFARSPPLSAQDVDGWRLREHVAFLFSEDDEEFHNLTTTIGKSCRS